MATAINGRVEAFFTVPAGITATVTTNGGTNAVAIAAATYTGITAFCAYLQTALIAQRPVTAGTWTVSISTTAPATGKVTIAVTNGVFSITWVGADLETILGFTANIAAVASSTGASQARGLWMPDCTVAADATPKEAPRVTDLRATRGPNGQVYAKVGCGSFQHTGIVWSHVAKNRVWIDEETTANESYERFHEDAIVNAGHAWFSPMSAMKLWDHNGNAFGNAKSVSSWTGTDIPGIETIRPSVLPYTGLLRVTWPEIVSSG